MPLISVGIGHLICDLIIKYLLPLTATIPLKTRPLQWYNGKGLMSRVIHPQHLDQLSCICLGYCPISPSICCYHSFNISKYMCICLDQVLVVNHCVSGWFCSFFNYCHNRLLLAHTGLASILRSLISAIWEGRQTDICAFSSDAQSASCGQWVL